MKNRFMFQAVDMSVDFIFFVRSASHKYERFNAITTISIERWKNDVQKMNGRKLPTVVPSIYFAESSQFHTFVCDKINVHNPFGQTSAHQLSMYKYTFAHKLVKLPPRWITMKVFDWSCCIGNSNIETQFN